jgi:hypothetical protein
MKRRDLMGVFSRRYVEVSAGTISWCKPEDVGFNVRVSTRRIAGAVIRLAHQDFRMEKINSNLHVFIVYLAYDTRELKVPALIFGTESEEDLKQWVTTIAQAAAWVYHPPCLQPLARRLCGLIVIEVIGVENIVPSDWSGKSDPFVLVSFSGLWGRTATHYRCVSAQFNDVICLPVYNDDPNQTIKLLVMDQDKFSLDDFLGVVSVPLHSLGFNKEIVWDSLPLRPTKGSVHSRSNSNADKYGVISFRTLYSSSKVTQFLPLKQVPTVEAPRAVLDGGSSKSSHDVVSVYSAALRKSLTEAGLDRLSSVSEEGSDVGSPREVKLDDSFASPKSGPSEPPSPKTGKETEAAEDEEYDFTIEMFKAQLVRILAIIKLFSNLKSIGYIISWRDPAWTLTLYLWGSWICLIEPQAALMFWLIFLLRLLLKAHPCYPELKQELKARWELGVFPRNKTCLKTLSVDKIGTSGEALTEFRVFECQRRKIAGAMTMLSTMVKVPAHMALAAGSAVAAPLRDKQGEDDEDGPPSSPSSPNRISKELEDLFVNFSSKNLKPGEHEWISPTGHALSESPTTVIDGMKIKWTVNVYNKRTDKNGWEYARHFSQEGGSERISFLPKVDVLWGSNQQFDRKLRVHKHWVRRRMWIGTAVRPALPSEEPIPLAQIVESTQGENKDAVVDKKQGRSLLARFKQLMEEGKKLQNVLFNLATRLESLKNLVSWKSRWISSLIFWVLMVLLFFSLFVSQYVIVWIIASAILLESLVDVLKLQGLTAPLRAAVLAQLSAENASTIPAQWRDLLKHKLNSYFCNMEEVLSEVPVSIVCSVFQKACDALWFKNAVLLSLDDFDLNTTGGPLTLGMVLEKVYLVAHNGDADWWKSVKVGIHPKNLFKGHLVSDWELYNPTSVFAPTN